MSYYRINVYQREDPDYCFIDRSPKEVGLLSAYITGGKPAAPEYPENVVAKMDSSGGIVLSDFIGNSELSLICSGRAKSVIEKMCGETCEYLPLSIENHRGRIASSDYFYINPLGIYDCLHQSLSDIRKTDDGKVIKVYKFVLDKKLLKDVPPLFRVKEDKRCYFASEPLIDALDKAIPDLTNLLLHSIEVSE